MKSHIHSIHFVTSQSSFDVIFAPSSLKFIDSMAFHCLKNINWRIISLKRFGSNQTFLCSWPIANYLSVINIIQIFFERIINLLPIRECILSVLIVSDQLVIFKIRWKFCETVKCTRLSVKIHSPTILVWVYFHSIKSVILLKPTSISCCIDDETRVRFLLPLLLSYANCCWVCNHDA